MRWRDCKRPEPVSRAERTHPKVGFATVEVQTQLAAKVASGAEHLIPGGGS